MRDLVERDGIKIYAVRGRKRGVIEVPGAIDIEGDGPAPRPEVIQWSGCLTSVQHCLLPQRRALGLGLNFGRSRQRSAPQIARTDEEDESIRRHDAVGLGNKLAGGRMRITAHPRVAVGRCDRSQIVCENGFKERAGSPESGLSLRARDGSRRVARAKKPGRVRAEVDLNRDGVDFSDCTDHPKKDQCSNQQRMRLHGFEQELPVVAAMDHMENTTLSAEPIGLSLAESCQRPYLLQFKKMPGSRPRGVKSGLCFVLAPRAQPLFWRQETKISRNVLSGS